MWWVEIIKINLKNVIGFMEEECLIILPSQRLKKKRKKKEVHTFS